MARYESDREDLLREATALVERVELMSADLADPIVAGFRADGSLSIYFGAEPVYQFNSAGELRRAYAGGRLIKAVHGQLIALRRERRDDEVLLLRHELDNAEQEDFLQKMASRLSAFARELAADAFQIVGQVPLDADVVTRIRTWLNPHLLPTVANRPNVM
jgi:hypothetical protein